MFRRFAVNTRGACHWPYYSNGILGFTFRSTEIHFPGVPHFQLLRLRRSVSLRRRSVPGILEFTFRSTEIHSPTTFRSTEIHSPPPQIRVAGRRDRETVLPPDMLLPRWEFGANEELTYLSEVAPYHTRAR